MRKKINLILIILWLIFIFVMSSFPSGDSSRQSGFIVNIISNLLGSSNTNLLTFIIRKSAHLCEYLILGILLFNYLKDYPYGVNLSIMIAVIYAISDEIHQIFIPGRSGEIRDIVIDILGAIIGILIVRKVSK